MLDQKLSQKWQTRTLIPACAAAVAALAGCSTSVVGTSSPVNRPATTMRGVIHGGQQPVAGAAVQLYVANATGGYGSSSSPLLASPVLTSSSGNFTINGPINCPSPNSLAYIVATGGNPGLGSNNANLALMAALGTCTNLNAQTNIQINELTTIASVYALAPFMSSFSAVGSSTANFQGLTNAFAIVNNLVDIGTGALSGPTLPPNAVLPTTELNTLADIIAACVNSGGGVANDGSTCGSLFQLTTPTGGPAPVDTIGASLNIARYPARNVTALVALNPPASPFQPTLSSATDFTVSIKYKSGGFSAPSASAVDASGNLWVTNANNSVSVLNPAGSPVTGSPFTGGGLSAPSAIAIDVSGNAWITDSASSKLSVFNLAGAGFQTAATGLAAPSSLAIDGQGTVWVTNSGNNTVTAVTTSGTTVSSSNSYATGGINAPAAVAINPY